MVNEVRNDTYRRLCQLASEVGVNADEMYEMLKVSDKAGEDGGLNTGNQVTNDVKFMVKVCCKQDREHAFGFCISRTQLMC